MENEFLKVEVYDEFEKLSCLQTEFIEDHQQLSENVYKTTYSNGSEIIVNYSDELFEENGIKVNPVSFILRAHS